MSKTIVYDVLRGHEGDRFYKEGGERELTEADAAHLVKLGVLRATGRKPKGPDASDRSGADSALTAISDEKIAKQGELDDIDAAITTKKVELSDLEAAIVAKQGELHALAAKPASESADEKNKVEPATAAKPDAAAKAKG